MTNCVVKGCKNQSSRNKKQDGITFHTFPSRDQNMKEKWIAVIRYSRNEPLWDATNRSVVCSTHFKSDDLYYTIKGLRRIKQDAYPKILPGISEQLNDEAISQYPTIVLTSSPDLSFSNSNQSSTSCAVQIEPPEQSFSDLNQSSTSFAVITSVSDQPILDLTQPSTSCAVKPVQSSLDPSIFDTPSKLRKTVLLLETKLKKKKRKIKTLNQKVRRLEKINKSLKEMLENFKSKST